MRKSTRLYRLKEFKFLMDNHDAFFSEAKVKLDMGEWFAPTGCGFAACALGSAALYPPFKEAGLRLRLMAPQYGDACGSNAGAKFFGISYQEARDVFLPVFYTGIITAKDVSEKITKLIKKYEK